MKRWQYITLSAICGAAIALAAVYLYPRTLTMSWGQSPKLSVSQMGSDDWKLGVSILAFFASLVSLYFTRLNWRQSNRPLVTAFVADHFAGNDATAFNLVLSNTGNRPAVRVRLIAPRKNIRKLVAPDTTDEHFELIERNFQPRNEVPLLRNGEELLTSFGAYKPNDSGGAWLNYGAEADISIVYQDLEGRSYKSRLPLKIYARKGFGGGYWGDPKSN